MLRLIPRLLLAACTLCLPALAIASTHFTHAERLVLPASPGNFSAPAKLLPDLPEEGWGEVALPDTGMARTPGQSDPRSVQSVWYRFTLDEATLASTQDLYFYLPRWQTVGQVAIYGDGRLLWHTEGDRVWNGFNQPVWVALEPPGLPRPGTVLLRMDGVPGLGGGITSAWIGTVAEQEFDLGAVGEPLVIYRGPVREGAAKYPQNVNISAAVALAGLGLDRTELMIVADPTIDIHYVEIQAEGAFGRFSFVEQVAISPTNRKTGRIVAMAVAKTVRQLAGAVHVGG